MSLIEKSDHSLWQQWVAKHSPKEVQGQWQIEDEAADLEAFWIYVHLLIHGVCRKELLEAGYDLNAL